MLPDNYECDGQMTVFEYLKAQKDYTFDRKGSRHEVPGWMNKDRCENCKWWELLPVEDQPPDGWGVMGQCNCFHDPEQMKGGYWKVSQTSYCRDYKDRSGGES